MRSVRAQRKALKAARQHLAPASEPIAYALAVGGPPPLWTVFLVLAGAVIIAVLTGGAIIPGLLGMILVFWVVNRPLGVVVTSHDVAVMKRSRLTGRPKPPVTMASHATFEMPTRSSGPWEGFSADSSVVWMTTTQAARTLNALPRKGRTGS